MGFFMGIQTKKNVAGLRFFFGGPKDVMEIGFITNGSLIYIFDSNIFSTICLISGKTTAHLVYSRICF